MRFRNRWIDRAWLTLIALSFVLIAPMWLWFAIERFGVNVVVGCIGLALVYRYFPPPE